MPATYRFTLNIMVDGKSFKAGDTIAPDDVPSCFESLKRLKQIVLDVEAPLDIEPPPTPPVAATNDDARKSKRTK